MHWFLAFSMFVNAAFGFVLYTTRTEPFLKLVDAAQKIQESHEDVQRSIRKFDSMVAEMKDFTLKADVTVTRIDGAIEQVKQDVHRIEDFLKF